MKSLFFSVLSLLLLFVFPASAQDKVEKWGLFELTLNGPEAGNPFIGTTLSATFTNGDQIYQPEGYYDGKGIYKIRFMPDKEGVWTYLTASNKTALDRKEGSFICTPAPYNIHGPVQIRNTYHFKYSDGKSFFPFGTTIYEWPFQDEVHKKQTIETLKGSPFNKARLLAIPPYKERYISGPLTISTFPFEGNSRENFDFSRFNPEYFKNLDDCVRQLRDIGVEADLILLRPYDKGKWGLDMMDQETNKRYVRYMVARYGAFSNIWWSLANENSFIKSMTDEHWDELFQLIQKKDPYQHLRSIHNADRPYNYSHPWVTHVSLQYYNAVKAPWGTPLLREIYGKPVVHDEINYEGNIANRWGRISGEELTFRIWNAYIGGGYATHGESFIESPWISYGGRLIGSSPARIAFLRKIVENGPKAGLEPIDQFYETNMAGKAGEYYLVYLGKEQPKDWKFILPKRELTKGAKFKVEIIDTWSMTVKPVDRVFEVEPLKGDNYRFADSKGAKVKLPGKPFIALRIQKVADGGEKASNTGHELE